MIYTTINTPEQFADHFKNSTRAEQFTHVALCRLFEYYEDLGGDMALDVIAICCEWSEYTGEEFLAQYGYMRDKGAYEDEEHYFDRLVNHISDHTTLLGVDGGYLVRDF